MLLVEGEFRGLNITYKIVNLALKIGTWQVYNKLDLY